MVQLVQPPKFGESASDFLFVVPVRSPFVTFHEPLTNVQSEASPSWKSSQNMQVPPPPTTLHAENSEVLPKLSVAVAVMNSPDGMVSGKVALKLALPFASG